MTTRGKSVWGKTDDEVRDGDLLPVVTLSLRPAIVPPTEESP